MELSVLSKDGKDLGRKAVLSDDVFGIEPNTHVVYLDVKHYLANQRQGTHKAKQRAEIARSTKKIVRQKGSGGARHGSTKAPTFVGGGRVFGPVPRDYDFKLNKKVKVLARKSVLSARAKENNISVIEDFTFESPKTKSYLAFLSALSLTGSKTLFILPDYDSNVYLSARNIPKTRVLSADEVSTYDLINADKLIISEGALSKIESILN
ncbi:MULTISPECIES: 50S ribosomal protein L4 [Emticicia]|uniref:50S ribosomal protein L4 n=1 Tax=Emticicia TaxID=312278 RepID=UPI000C76A5F3|nr:MULTISPECIES: 50S ribosomal protein L4 [Emticicia]PLK43468.1 50S ribosomal protein L4 [Emticicia sp. TH156]UTA68954.1 50S ribosomal protein L4 [Emticicia sp. 21SJ11W-3]